MLKKRTGELVLPNQLRRLGATAPESQPQVAENYGSIDATPVTIGVDPSPSTFASGSGASELIRLGCDKLVSQLTADPLLHGRVSLRPYWFANHQTTDSTPGFVPAESFQMPEILPSNGTYIFELYVRMVSEMIQEIDSLSREFDRDVKGAIIFFFSDFLVMSSDTQHEDAAMRAKDLAEEWSINIVLVGCGNRVDEAVMTKLSQPGRTLMMHDGADFKSWFTWLYTSLRSFSQSMPGQAVTLQPYNGKQITLDAQ